MTAADHANTVREAGLTTRESAALDALVAQAEAAVSLEDYKTVEGFWLAARQRAEAAEAELRDANAAIDDLIAEKQAAEAERDRLREALDRIEAEPEDPLKVQAIARAALATDRTEAQPENTSQYCVCGHILGSPECCNFEDAQP